MGITIDGDRCQNCGKCVDHCPCGVYELRKGEPPPVVVREEACMACGHCMLSCPEDAISVPGLDYGMVHKTGPLPSATQMENLILGRRSVRRYLDRPVERELVERILELAAMAPTARNRQSTEYHVITDRKKIAEITSMTAADMSKIAKMMNGSFGRVMARLVMGKEMFPSVVEVQPMVRYIVGEHKEGRDAVLYNAPAVVTFHADPTETMALENAQLAMQNAMLALPAYGLGGFYSGFVPVMAQRDRALVSALGVPTGHKLYGVLTIGYDAEKVDRYIERKPKITWG